MTNIAVSQRYAMRWQMLRRKLMRWQDVLSEQGTISAVTQKGKRYFRIRFVDRSCSPPVHRSIGLGSERDRTLLFKAKALVGAWRRDRVELLDEIERCNAMVEKVKELAWKIDRRTTDLSRESIFGGSKA